MKIVEAGLSDLYAHAYLWQGFFQCSIKNSDVQLIYSTVQHGYGYTCRFVRNYKRMHTMNHACMQCSSTYLAQCKPTIFFFAIIQ